MAEFCVKCWEKMNKGTRYVYGGYKPYKYVLGEDLCEGCGKWRRDCIYDFQAGALLELVQYIKFKKGYYDIEFDVGEEE